MASKKKAKKAGKPAKKKAAKPAKKKSGKKAVKKTVRKAAKKAPARKAAKKAPARKAVKAKAIKTKKRAAPARKKQIVGEGDYAASRTFLKDQAGFVKKNKTRIPALGQAAEQAFDGAEGAALRAAEAAAKSHSKAGPGELTIDAAQDEALKRNVD